MVAEISRVSKDPFFRNFVRRLSLGTFCQIIAFIVFPAPPNFFFLIWFVLVLITAEELGKTDQPKLPALGLMILVSLGLMSLQAFFEMTNIIHAREFEMSWADYFSSVLYYGSCVFFITGVVGLMAIANSTNHSKSESSSSK